MAEGSPRGLPPDLLKGRRQLTAIFMPMSPDPDNSEVIRFNKRESLVVDRDADMLRIRVSSCQVTSREIDQEQKVVIQRGMRRGLIEVQIIDFSTGVALNTLPLGKHLKRNIHFVLLKIGVKVTGSLY